jgi:hypothetical protein
MENLIENAQTLFDERLPQSSPPLPPAPAGEPVPVISYGSSHTKVTLAQTGDAQVADFSPQLPPRPTSSIHPSARNCPPMSPSRRSADLSTSSTPPASSPPPPPPLKIQTSTNTTDSEQVKQEKATPDTGVSVVERIADEPQDFVPPPTTVREQYREERRSAAGSAPETPLTASSLASNGRSVSE